MFASGGNDGLREACLSLLCAGSSASAQWQQCVILVAANSCEHE